ncbi:MAG: Rieske (2Fe-2S) protein [Bacteroidales bacterium]
MKRAFFTVMLMLGLAWSSLFFTSCESNRGQIIPYVKVDLYLFLYADLADMGIGTTKVIRGEGVNGIVLYRVTDLEFRAFDRTCTLWPEHNAAVVEDPGFFGVFECPECGSTYLLMNGGEPNSGPATYPLVEYRTAIQKDVLHIFN